MLLLFFCSFVCLLIFVWVFSGVETFIRIFTDSFSYSFRCSLIYISLHHLNMTNSNVEDTQGYLVKLM